MPTFQYPRSLIAQFPEENYRQHGISSVLPLLMACPAADSVVAEQLLKLGRVRLTFDDPDTAANVLESGIVSEGTPLLLSPTDTRLRTVHLRDLPNEVEDEVVTTFFSEYGEVLSVSHGYFDEFPNMRNVWSK